MQTKKRTLEAVGTIFWILALVGSTSFPPGDALAAKARSARKGTSAVHEIRLSFKVDSRLSGPTYGGERWVSPRTYTTTSPLPVSAKAELVDANGTALNMSAEWTAVDRGMVDVSPVQGNEVKIWVKHAG